jgi:hypothetical protein
MRNLSASIILVSLFATPTAWAENSGFLSDYSNLEPLERSGKAIGYIAPGAADTISRFNRVMVDQPSIIISPDSKYKGAKPSDMVEVGEALRAGVIEGIGDSFPVVEEPGDGAALLSWAVSNIYLKKAKRGVLGYTPVGAVAYGAKKMMTDVVDKTRAFDVVIEIEATDSVSGEVLFAMMYDTAKEGEEVEWEEALAFAQGIGRRVGCRLGNSRLAEGERVDCLAIPLTQAE